MGDFTRKVAKTKAKQVLKKHYWILIVACLFAAILGTDFNGSLKVLTIENPLAEEQEDQSVVTTVGTADLVEAYLDDQSQIFDKMMDTVMKREETQGFKVGAIQLGRSKGILAGFVNHLSSGTLIISLMSAIKHMTGSTGISKVIGVLVGLLVYLGFWGLLINMFSVVYSRIFLESRTYEKVSLNRFTYLLHVKKWFKVSLAMFKKSVYILFWSLTIIGGFVKKYSYFLVPMILAENPSLSGSQAITLSRKMMKGHKWRFFVIRLSFILWNLLDNITFGLLGVFYLNAYKTGTFVEFYVKIRENWIETKGEGYELLNDKYLYEKADTDQIMEVYADIKDIKAPEKLTYKSTNKVASFFANVFGIVLFYNKEEDAYRRDLVDLQNANMFKNVLAGKAYPSRLSTIPEKEKIKQMENMSYARCYSVVSVVALFFILSLIGWLWEGSLHLVKDGVWVNRGVLHGPWLPIYGSGGVLILVILAKFRRWPWLEFVLGMVLAGIVEYTTHWYLALTHNGQKWWDYSGYFLNINGRICAEGLLVFGLGGVAAIYFLAPMLDNLLRKINVKILAPICAVLLIVFFADQIYSQSHPNAGKGITDYDNHAQVEVIDLDEWQMGA